jgi:hypothetical protein
VERLCGGRYAPADDAAEASVPVPGSGSNLCKSYSCYSCYLPYRRRRRPAHATATTSAGRAASRAPAGQQARATAEKTVSRYALWQAGSSTAQLTANLLSVPSVLLETGLPLAAKCRVARLRWILWHRVSLRPLATASMSDGTCYELAQSHSALARGRSHSARARIAIQSCHRRCAATRCRSAGTTCLPAGPQRDSQSLRCHRHRDEKATSLHFGAALSCLRCVPFPAVVVGYGRAAVVLEGDISKLTAGMLGQKWEPRWVVLTATTLDIYKVCVVAGPVGTHTCV